MISIACSNICHVVSIDVRWKLPGFSSSKREETNSSIERTILGHAATFLIELSDDLRFGRNR